MGVTALFWKVNCVFQCVTTSNSYFHRESELAIAIALVVSVGNSGGLIGPNLYGFTVVTDTDSNGDDVSESYMIGHLCLFGVCVLLLVSTFAMWMHLRRAQMGYEVI
jgi:hypothetical protein